MHIFMSVGGGYKNIVKSDGSTTQSSSVKDLKHISKIKNIYINSGDVFIHDQMISLCTDGEKCTKLADQGKCCSFLDLQAVL